MTAAEVERAVEAAYGHYRPEAVKRGRNPAFPYVPVIRVADLGAGQTTQIPKRAFATRDEALNCARRQIDAYKSHFRKRVADPRCRALREQWGLPRELA